ncbi:hypothetical protein EWB00_001997 [Schistosoma japonicum]|uniref:Uncharacterized protein n=1 Tax=Schistosoma japonicum TaxID=6182 RepID=A0A4Z2CJT6_SCHJA|nr:hypothetical protein EWB00_001997 [Schistosoma japonicum]
MITSTSDQWETARTERSTIEGFRELAWIRSSAGRSLGYVLLRTYARLRCRRLKRSLQTRIKASGWKRETAAQSASGEAGGTRNQGALPAEQRLHEKRLG